MKTCAADQLKQELMERYGLKANQIKIELNITLPEGEEEKALSILNDFNKYPKATEGIEMLTAHGDTKLGQVYGKKIHTVWVHVMTKLKEGVH